MVAVPLVLGSIPFLVSLAGGCALDAGGSTTCTSPIGWLGWLVSVIGLIVASVAVSLVAAEAYADVPSGWRRATWIGVRSTVTMFVAAFVFGVLVGIGFLILIIPGIFLWVSFAVIWEALIIEGLGPIESMKRSWRLVAGERWRVLGAGLLTTFLAMIVLGIVLFVIWLIVSPGLGVSDGVAAYLVEHVGILLAMPLHAAVTTVIYLDLRVRKESLTKDELAAVLSERV